MLESLINDINRYLHRLFPLCRSITGEPNRDTLKILQEIIPLQIYEVATGSKVYDWTIPDEWSVHNAWIANSSGRRIVDFNKNNLHLVSYSIPVRQNLRWDALCSHIHTHPSLPEAIPYRTSYYRQDWGFCVTHSQYEELSKENEPLEVVIDTSFKPGSLSYGELLLPGQSNREILISSYICHPSMANDSLSGVILTAFLAKYLSELNNRKWSYRIIFVPETIGAIAYCSLNKSAMKKIDAGLVITTVGGNGPFGYKQSWNSEHWLNSLVEKVLNNRCLDYKKYPFDIHGSDERQYSSQGFRINICTISKDKYYEYEQYHSSLDDLNFVTAENISDSYSVYIDLIDSIERLKIYQNLVPNGEPMLSKYNLYPSVGGAISHKPEPRNDTDLILWLLFLCDGLMPVQAIAEKIGVDIATLDPHVKCLLEAKLIKEI